MNRFKDVDLSTLRNTDFIVSELEELINETPMSIDDKMLAYKLFIESSNYFELWSRLMSTLKIMLGRL